MAESLIRRLILSKAPLNGFYRFGGVFQLTPAPESWPRPPYIMGDYPLILELRYDPQIAPERQEDYWHRDVWERARDHDLGTEGWTDGQITERRRHTEMMRSTAIVKELTVLLSALTNHRFFEYVGLGSWIFSRFDPGAAKEEGNTVHTTWAQTGYRMPELSWPDGEFYSDLAIEEAPRVPYGGHYKNVPDSYLVGSNFEIHFPDALDELLSVNLRWMEIGNRRFMRRVICGRKLSTLVRSEHRAWHWWRLSQLSKPLSISWISRDQRAKSAELHLASNYAQIVALRGIGWLVVLGNS